MLESKRRLEDEIHKSDVVIRWSTYNMPSNKIGFRKSKCCLGTHGMFRRG